MTEIETKDVKELMLDFIEVLEKEFVLENFNQMNKKKILEKSENTIYGLPKGLTCVNFKDATLALNFLITILNGLLMNFLSSCCFISTMVSDKDFTKMMVFLSADIANHTGLSGVVSWDDITDVNKSEELTCLDVRKLQKVCEYLYKTDFQFVNYSFSSITDLCDFIKTFVKENKTDIFFIHHLEENKNLELIDNLAKELNIAIVATCEK